MDNLKGKAIAMRYNRSVDYYIPKDLGYTLGTVYKNMQIWLKKELSHVVKFNHVYIDTTVMYEKDFLWSKGLIAQTRKPCLALQFALDFTETRTPWEHPSMRNLEAAKWLPAKDFTYEMLQFEDDNDFSNNLQVSFGMKNIKTTLNVGIATTTRMEATNIINYWNTRRTDGYGYNINMVVDFKIPPVIIALICKKFNVDMSNHHEVLKFLNKNSTFNVFYGMDGNYGKFYYFIRYKMSPIIRLEGTTNPQGYEVSGLTQANVWTFNRQVEMDIQVPSIIALTKYGDHIDFDSLENDIQQSLVEDKYVTNANVQLNERVLEIERVIDEKHAIKQIEFRFTEDDIISHEGTDLKTTNKIDLKDFIKEDEYIEEFVKWALDNGYTYLDLFNFKLYRIKSTEYKVDPNMSEIDVADKSEEEIEDLFGKEYVYYLKNIHDMYFIDVNPDIRSTYVGVIYCNLKIENEFKVNSKYYKEHIVNDDFGIQMAVGDKILRSHLGDTIQTDTGIKEIDHDKP
jgi:hypothetical protein